MEKALLVPLTRAVGSGVGSDVGIELDGNSVIVDLCVRICDCDVDN